MSKTWASIWDEFQMILFFKFKMSVGKIEITMFILIVVDAFCAIELGLMKP
jgi:hypothetical protein